jgi:ParB/RepB/Spo0J family partition protein
LAAITVSDLNSRKNLEAGSEDVGIAELAASIRATGLISPPSVRARGDGTYEVIAGQRRVLACQSLGWTNVDAFVTDLTDDEALGVSPVENLQRADMHPLDKARGLEDLVRRLGSEHAAERNDWVQCPDHQEIPAAAQAPGRHPSADWDGSGSGGSRRDVGFGEELW